MSDTGRPARLSRDEVAIVLRRAAEIDAAGLGPSDADGYDPAAVEAAAGEVGLSPEAVRRAVAELRVGSLADEPEPKAARRRRARTGRAVAQAAGPVPNRRRADTVVDQRTVRFAPDDVLGAIDRLLRSQMFLPGRRTGDRAVFRPRDDLAAKLRRKLDLARTIRLDGISCVTAVATPADGGTLVRVEAELERSRASVLAGSAGAGAGVALTMGFAGALVGEAALVIAALPAGTFLAAGGMRVRAQRWELQREEIGDSLAAVLDRL